MRRTRHKGAQVQGSGDPGVEQSKEGSRSIRLTLQAEGEAAPPVRAANAQLRLPIEQSAIEMGQCGRVVGGQHDRTHHPHLIHQ